MSRRRKNRFGDKHKAATKPVFQPKPGEGYKERHARRLEFNLEAQEKVRVWCDDHGVALKINNYGHHWIFTRDKRRVEWWPSSAKLVIDQQWKKGIHVHDYTQALEELAKVFPALIVVKDDAPPVVEIIEAPPTRPWYWWMFWWRY